MSVDCAAGDLFDEPVEAIVNPWNGNAFVTPVAVRWSHGAHVSAIVTGRTLVLLVVVALVGPLVGCTTVQLPASAARSAAELDQLTVLTSRPDRPAYDRSCRSDRGCSFGPAWTDSVDASLGGHNGCDQNSEVLKRDLIDVVIKPNTSGCTPLSGTLNDLYTGRTIHYVRGQHPTLVSTDHLVPLKLGWDLGADTWTLQKRENFAGDPANLTVVSASANSAKGDSSPADWKPQPSYRCTYAERFVNVLTTYELPVTVRDKLALQSMLKTCPHS